MHLKRTPPTALLATLTALACAAAAPAPASAASPIRVGLGDQNVSTFSNPAFQALDLRQVRTFVRWDVMSHETERRALRTYVRTARAQGMRPLVHLSTTTFDPKEAPRPSVARYRAHAKRLVSYLRRYGVRDFGVMNEANHKTQPTWDSPNHAALYFRELYRAVHRSCSTRSCRVVALDVLDQPGVERYIERFYDRLSPTWRKRARFIGIHNYSDVNRDSRTRTRRIIKEVRSHQRSARFWFTETGGIVQLGRGFPCDPERAADKLRNVFSVARTYRTSGVQRIYVYNWTGSDCSTRFDAGLVDAAGNPRPAYDVFRRSLRAPFAR